MARRVIGMAGKVKEHWSRRWGAVLSLVLAVAAGLLFVQKVLAVHELAFELEGDIITQGFSDFPTHHVGTVDWASFFDATGAELPLPVTPAGFTASGFVRDFATETDRRGNLVFTNADPSTYATGSKDTLPISGWQCGPSNNVLSKDDIMNAYAAAYTDPISGDQIIYFGLERNANTGDANVGFWFLQDEVDCSSSSGNVTFTGHHRDGDILIVSAFTKGGDVSVIDAYRWTGDDATGSLVLVPTAHGTDCRAGTVGTGDNSCAAANTDGTDPNLPNIVNGVGGTITSPWLTSAKTLGVGHSLPTGQFFEGGLNLSETDLGGHCFNVFIGDTRSSQSPTATLFDFARGRLGECTSDTVTTPSVTVDTIIPASGTLSVTDSATVTVTGIPSFTGTVTFHLCGPFALGSATLCGTGGVAAGSKAVSESLLTVVSDSMTITEVGRYCWRADFAEDDDAGIPPSSDSRSSECFNIKPRTPTLSTQFVGSPVNFGDPVQDNATLGNTANQEGSGGPAGSTDGSINPTVAGAKAGGSITFTLYKKLAAQVNGSFCGAIATGTGTNPQTVSPVNGDGTYGPVSFTPDAPGTYSWQASYSGDSPNTDPKSHNLDCTDGNEDVVVRQIPTAIKTKQGWIPNDTATIASTIGNLAAGGSVAFSLYDNPTCSGTALFSQSKTLTGGAPTEEVSTTNTGTGVGMLTITTGYTDAAGSTKGKYSWLIVYTPAAADTAHEGRKSLCDSENFTITYTNDAGPGVKNP